MESFCFYFTQVLSKHYLFSVELSSTERLQVIGTTVEYYLLIISRTRYKFIKNGIPYQSKISYKNVIVLRFCYSSGNHCGHHIGFWSECSVRRSTR